MNINYEYYRIFYYVAKLKSFTQAAACLMNSQPNITRTIRNLERELGCPLFIRSNRQVTLTAEGEALYRHVTIAVEQLQAADRLALSGEWAEALDALWESYDDWSHSQTYLHIVSHHDAVDDAEAMYRRAIAFGETEELSEFHAELSDLRDQLRLIAEMEALNIRNVL